MRCPFQTIRAVSQWRGAAESQERTEFIMVSRGVRAGMNDA